MTLRTAILGIVGALSFTIGVAAAAPSITIPISTVIWGDVGSEHALGTKSVDTDLQGLACSVHAVAENQSSVHTGNSITVSSNGSSVVLENVERAPGVTTTADGSLTLGSELKAVLTLGKDAVFSGGMDVTLNCDQPEPIEVCRDGQVISIDPRERQDSDTDAPCPQEPKEVTVCRNNQVIAINEDERQASDTTAPCPEVLAEVDELPNTGTAGVIAGFVGTSALGLSIRAWFDSKKSLRRRVLNQ